jgi:hypothetical protein
MQKQVLFHIKQVENVRALCLSFREFPGSFCEHLWFYTAKMDFGSSIPVGFPSS